MPPPRRLAEVTGMAVQVGGERRYLGGRLPVGDAFLAWSLAADGWIVPAGQGDAVALDHPSPWWRLPWHLATLLLLAAGWLSALLALRRFRGIRRHDPPGRFGYSRRRQIGGVR